MDIIALHIASELFRVRSVVCPFAAWDVRHSLPLMEKCEALLVVGALLGGLWRFGIRQADEIGSLGVLSGAGHDLAVGDNGGQFGRWESLC